MINSHGFLDCNVEFYRPSDSKQIRKVFNMLTQFIQKFKIKRKMHSITDDERTKYKNEA